ncbi:MAG: glycosyltransferase family 4 protein [Lachnospiraceae bacterium]|nr:glycosyltransferase family 4 protein [Lachnospiraceae bacterium]
MKNVMYIFNDAGFGGAGQSLLDTLAEIRNDVNPIIIIRDDADVENQFITLGVRCYKIKFLADYVKIGSANADKRVCDIKQSYEAAQQLVPIIKKENIQLIHINSSVSYFAAIAALMAGIPYIWHIRELMEEQFGCEFLNEELKKSLYKKANKIITISDYVQEKHCKKIELETVRLYNGINIRKFKQKIETKDQFEKTFIVTAMITPEKGQWNVIQATERLVKRGHTDIKVIIVGGGAATYVWALKKYVKKNHLEKNVFILPFQDDLSALRSQTSYAITSSQNEALGRVTIEAMLAGNVVIGAASGGTIEIIGENEERGFLYKLGDSESLADTMEQVIALSSDTKNEIIKRAQQYAENTFDSKQYCKKLINIYDEIVRTFERYDDSAFLNAIREYYESVKDIEDADEKNKRISYMKSASVLEPVLKWLEIRQKGHSLKEYFRSNNIRSIAVYGMGILGCRFYDELEDSDIEIKYLIDRNPNGMDKVLEFVSLDNEKIDVSAIVVTVISQERQIINEILMRGYRKVIGLSEIINSIEVNGGYLDGQ